MPPNNTEETTANPPTTLLTLPPELRTLIYNHLTPSSRLTPFPLHDAEWSPKPSDPSVVRNPPAFIFTHRTIYAEAAPLFYSLATLEVAPAQQGNNWFNVRLGAKVISHAYSRLLSTFRRYSAAHLRLIRAAHVYSNQVDVIDGECYEALLQWLVEHTGVEAVQLSLRPMTRIRETARFDLPSWRAMFVGSPSRDLRVVRVWTRAERPLWDYEKMLRLHCSPENGRLIPLQIYFFSAAAAAAAAAVVGGEGDERNVAAVTQLQLDPRWLTRHHDEIEEKGMTDEAALLIDALMEQLLQGQELVNYKDHRRHLCGKSWLYQMIVIAKT